MLKHTTLSLSPELYNQVIGLCEKSFEYKSGQSYAEDFAPLVSPMNHQHNHVFLNSKNQLVGHIGIKERIIVLKNNIYTFSLLGGIAVSEEFRGQGHLKEMMQTIIEIYENKSAFFLLWSDLTELYQRFSFYEAGLVYEYSSQNRQDIFKTKKLEQFSEDEFNLIQNLFLESTKSLLTFKRSRPDWELLREMTSCDWYLNSQTREYFVANKGRDLDGVVFEHNIENPETLQRLISQFKVWSPTLLPLENQSLLYTAFFKAVPNQHFNEFIRDLTDGKCIVELFEKENIIFKLEGSSFQLPMRDFIQGLWGPDHIKELSQLSPAFYVSGLDSI